MDTERGDVGEREPEREVGPETKGVTEETERLNRNREGQKANDLVLLPLWKRPAPHLNVGTKLCKVKYCC
jgi:hypothetical protein